nr:hypothetical protein CFP56_36280 [Quercus suber]
MEAFKNGTDDIVIDSSRDRSLPTSPLSMVKVVRGSQGSHLRAFEILGGILQAARSQNLTNGVGPKIPRKNLSVRSRSVDENASGWRLEVTRTKQEIQDDVEAEAHGQNSPKIKEGKYRLYFNRTRVSLEIVRLVGEYFYQLDFQVAGEDAALIHAKVFAAAVEYGIAGLRVLYIKNFRTALHHCRTPPEIAETIRTACTTTSENIVESRDVMNTYLVDHLYWLEYEIVQAVVRAIDGLAFDLLDALSWLT